MKLLILTRYSKRGASSRIRFYQYERYFRQAGIDVTYWNLFDDRYLQLRYREVSDIYQIKFALHTAWRMASHLKRLITAAKYNLIYIEGELLPYAHWIIERGLLNKLSPFVIDYDDATYVHYREHSSILARFLGKNKIEHLVSLAQGVIAANPIVAKYVHAYNHNVWFIPDGIDLQRYGTPKRHDQQIGPPVIGWLGTPVTSRYIKTIENVLTTVVDRTGARIRVVGDPGFSLTQVNVETLPWSNDNEVADIKSFDIGIMPLDTTAFSQGKSGYKLLQYMGSGLPVVASPVGINEQIVRHNQNGFLATTNEEWIQALIRLIESAKMRSEFCQVGYRDIQLTYSTDVLASQLLGVLKHLAE